MVIRLLLKVQNQVGFCYKTVPAPFPSGLVYTFPLDISLLAAVCVHIIDIHGEATQVLLWRYSKRHLVLFVAFPMMVAVNGSNRI